MVRALLRPVDQPPKSAQADVSLVSSDPSESIIYVPPKTVLVNMNAAAVNCQAARRVRNRSRRRSSSSYANYASGGDIGANARH